MLCEQLQPNLPFKIKSKNLFYFSLHNVALDLKSQEAALFLILENKEILIVEMSRQSTGLKSSNINLDFQSESDVVLISKGGSVHIIGGFRPKNTTTLSLTQISKNQENNTKNVVKQTEDQTKQSQVDTSRQQEKPITLRRSSRARTVVPVQKNNKSLKKQKQAIKNMANYFGCEDLDDDEQDSYSEKEQSSSSQSQDSSKMEEQFSQDSRMGRKKKASSMKEKKISGQISQKSETKSNQCSKARDFSVPTKNPYE